MKVKTFLRRLENNLEINGNKYDYDLIYIHKNEQQLINFDSFEENLSALRDKERMESSAFIMWDYCFDEKILEARVKSSFVSVSHIPSHHEEIILNIIIESKE